MNPSSSFTGTSTFSVADIEAVMKNLKADFRMIAQSSNAITEAKADDYSHDVQELATAGYLKKVNLMLFSNGVEKYAVEYTPNTDAGGLTSSRPGGVNWPRVENAKLEIVLSHNKSYDAEAEKTMRNKLRINWVSTSMDTSHSTLTHSSGRDYTSNSYGMNRRDFG
jgi:hypothetical protein